MEYIISNSRFREIMESYLDSFVAVMHISDLDNFILISQPTDGDDWVDFMEYAWEDSRLWINRDFIKNFCTVFPINEEQSKGFIKKWFENKFNVEIDYVES